MLADRVNSINKYYIILYCIINIIYEYLSKFLYLLLGINSFNINTFYS